MKHFVGIFLGLYIFSLFSIFPASAQDLSNGLIVELSSDTTLEQFKTQNNLSDDQIQIGFDNFVMIKNYQAPQDDMNKKGGQINYGLSGVDNAEINGEYELHLTPNDPKYSTDQWNLENIHMPQAWNESKGSKNTIVAVLDTGFYKSHEDMQDIIWNNVYEIPNNGMDDDNNGFVDDVNGYNMRDDNNNLTDNFGHGTAVSSIIVANTDNSVGLAGLNWNTTIMPVKVCSDSGSCSWFDVANGVYYAVNNGAKVINMSLGGYSGYYYLENAVKYAHQNNVVVVASSGNSSTYVFYPAAYDEVIAVGSVDQNDTKSSFSNYGPNLDLVAPGSDVLVAGNSSPSSYHFWSGTSFSAPHVAGAAAMIKSFAPSLSNDEIRSYIVQNAEKVDGMGGDFFHQYYGYGRLDVYNSLYQIKKDRGDISIEGIHESEGLYHQIGEIISDTQASQNQAVKTITSDGPGFVQYGPYVGENIAGNSYYAKFRLKTDDFGSSNKMARLEVLNTQNSGEWFVQDVYGTDFDSNEYHDFYLKFDKNNVGSIEYRIYSYGTQDFVTDFVEARQNFRDNKFDFQSEDLYRQIGQVVYDEKAFENFTVQVNANEIGHAQYGPYVSNLTKDKYRANFRLKTSSFISNTDIAILEVFNHTNPSLSATHILKASDFTKTTDYENIGLCFNVENGDVLEYRVYSYGNNENISFKIDAVKIEYDIYGPTINFEAEDMPSQTGMMWSEDFISYDRARVAHANYDAPGYLVYGPYTDELKDNEDYYVKFRMKTNLGSVNQLVARIEAYNPGGTSEFMSREITTENFAENLVWQDFTLHFTKGEGGLMEFRVWFYGNCDLYLDNIKVIEKFNSNTIYQAEDLFLGSVGTVIRDSYNQSIAVSSEASSGAGYLVYGPYTKDLSPGHYRATFKIRNRGDYNGYVAKIDAVNVGGYGAYSYSDLVGGDFTNNNYHFHSIEFDRTSDGVMEFRLFTYGHTDIAIDHVYVEKMY